jgi:hypothetical protein
LNPVRGKGVAPALSQVSLPRFEADYLSSSTARIASWICPIRAHISSSFLNRLNESNLKSEMQ